MIKTPSHMAVATLRWLICNDATDNRTGYEGCAWKPITIVLAITSAGFVIATVAIEVGMVSATLEFVPAVLAVLVVCSLLLVFFELNLLNKVWCRLHLNESGS
tara:strand:- start:354 stop:662 length:309 start_codon:yes stop_codon:yes gene_type:complete